MIWDSLHKAELSTGVRSSMHLLQLCWERGQNLSAFWGYSWTAVDCSIQFNLEAKCRAETLVTGVVHVFLTGLFGRPLVKIMAQTPLVTCSSSVLQGCSRTVVSFPQLTGKWSKLCSQHCRNKQCEIVTSSQKPDQALEAGNTTVRTSVLLRAAEHCLMMTSGFSLIFLLEGEGLSLSFGVAGFLNSRWSNLTG